MTDCEHIKYVDVEGLRTRYYENGAGEPLVLVHGGAIGTGSSLNIFDQNLEALAQSFHVFAVDKIGQGYTDNPATDADYTIESMTRHTHQFVRTLGLQRINLIGQSRGAFNGVSICLDDPDLVRGFVLCNSASMAPGVAAIPAFSKKMRASVPFEAGTREWIKYRTDAMSFSNAGSTEAYIDEWHKIYHLAKSKTARSKMKTLGTSQFEPSVDAAKEREMGRIREGAFRVPTLVHWGKNDPSAPLDPDGLNVFNLLADHSADVSLHVANRAGHFAFKERNVEFNHLAKAFFASLG